MTGSPHNINPKNFNTMTKYRMNTGGGCLVTYTETGKKDSSGRDLIKVTDNWTGLPARIVPVEKYAQAFELSDGSRFYLSEFTPVGKSK